MAVFKCCRWTINRKMLPMKLHYLFYSTACGSALVFVPLIAKNIGINATGLGIMFTIVPFITVLINPILGCITDKFQKIKLMIIYLTVMHTPIYFSINFIPEIAIEKQILSNVTLQCNNNTFSFIESPKFLSLNPNNKSFECEVECSICSNDDSENNNKSCQQIFTLSSEPYLNRTHNLQIQNTTFENNLTFPVCSQNLNEKCDIKCFLDSDEQTNSFLHYQFWLFVIICSVGIVITNAIIAISDTACYESLEGRVNQFGKQRVWLSLGWGIISIIMGYIVELANVNNKGKTDFSVCYYMMLPLMLFDIISLGFTNMKKKKSSNNILNDVRKIFVKPHPFFLVFAVFLDGTFSGLQWNYAFWYLEELNASKLLMGLHIAVLCIFGEVPFMFISGWIIKRIGRDNSMCMAFIAFSIWFLSTSFLHNPWWIILPDLTQGPCYGLFYAAMTSYGKLIAPVGTEATMQTILGAAFHGLGIGTGSLLGGICFDEFGGRLTYRFVGYIAIAMAILYKCITVFIAGENSNTKVNKEENEKKVKTEEICRDDQPLKTMCKADTINT